MFDVGVPVASSVVLRVVSNAARRIDATFLLLLRTQVGVMQKLGAFARGFEGTPFAHSMHCALGFCSQAESILLSHAYLPVYGLLVIRNSALLRRSALRNTEVSSCKYLLASPCYFNTLTHKEAKP